MKRAVLVLQFTEHFLFFALVAHEELKAYNLVIRLFSYRFYYRNYTAEGVSVEIRFKRFMRHHILFRFVGQN